MKQVWTARMAQAVGRYGEHAPMAGVCCNACRTCTVTNVIGLVFAGVTGLGVAFASLAKRVVGAS